MRTAAIAALALAFAVPAQAHIVGHPQGSSLKATLAFQERAYAHARYVCVKGSGEVKRWHCAASQWIRRELRHTRARLQPSPSLGALSCASCWDRVASCESGGNWHIATGNGFYGGLQFLPSTWLAYGGGQYASMPHYASRTQQIAVASHMSLSAWPVCGARY